MYRNKKRSPSFAHFAKEEIPNRVISARDAIDGWTFRENVCLPQVLEKNGGDESAVTVIALQVLSTTWKGTDGTASHWKYVVGNVIVYRDMYREGFCRPCLTDE